MSMIMRNKQNVHNQVEMKSIFEIKLSKEEYGGIFDKKPTFYEKRAFAAIFRRKWREDQGYCSLFDKRIGYKKATDSQKKKNEIVNTLHQDEENKVNPHNRRIRTAVNSKRRKISQRIHSSIVNSEVDPNLTQKDQNQVENEGIFNENVDRLEIGNSNNEVHNNSNISVSKRPKRLNIKRENRSQKCSRSKHKKALLFKTQNKVNVETSGFQSSPKLYSRTNKKSKVTGINVLLESRNDNKNNFKREKHQSSVSSLGNIVTGDSQNLSGLYFRSFKMIPNNIRESSFVRRQKIAMKLTSQNKTLNAFKEHCLGDMKLKILMNN